MKPRSSARRTNMPQPHHLWPDVNIGGTPLSTQTEALLEQVVVDHHQHLPDMFAITFHDPDRDVISQLGVNIGSPGTLQMTPPCRTAAPVIKGAGTRVQGEY